VTDNDTLHDQDTGALDGCLGTAFDVTALTLGGWEKGSGLVMWRGHH
jgi:hypothetical protein